MVFLWILPRDIMGLIVLGPVMASMATRSSRIIIIGLIGFFFGRKQTTLFLYAGPKVWYHSPK